MRKIFLMFIVGLLFTTCGEKDKSHTFVDPPVTDIDEWVVNPSDFEFFMTAVAEIQLDGNILCGLNNKLAAFNGNELCGVVEPYEHQECALFNLIIYSNDLDATITFGVYLADEDRPAACTNEIIFEAGAGLGTPDTPYIIEIE